MSNNLNTPWARLTQKEKAELIGLYTRYGYNELASIINNYNSYKDGGPLSKEEKTKLINRINSTSKADFVERLKDPNRKTIPYGDGVATHRLAYATDDTGTAIVYPEVQSYENTLKEFVGRDAIERAIERRDTLNMSIREADWFTKHYKEYYPGFNRYKDGGYLTNEFARGGGIHIKESKEGTFTAAAKSRGMGVQEFASKVLANKDEYSSAMVKKANFARNSNKWHADGGNLYPQGGPIQIQPALKRIGEKIRTKYITDYINKGGVEGYPENVFDWIAYAISPYKDTDLSWHRGKDYDMARRALLAKYMGVTEGLSFNPDDYIEESPYKPSQAQNANAKYYRPIPKGEYQTAIFDAVSGNYKLDKGEDEHGRYASFYDIWDLAPFSGNGNELGGTPIELYDRVYENEDPFTYYMYFPNDRPSRKRIDIKSTGGPLDLLKKAFAKNYNTETFSQAFAAARNDDRDYFKWNGNRYNTKLDTESFRESNPSNLKEGYAIQDAVRRIMQVENNKGDKRGGWDEINQRWYPHRSPEGGADTIAYGIKLSNGTPEAELAKKQGYLTDEQALDALDTLVQKYYGNAKSTYDKKFGDGSWDSLSEKSKSILTDYEYNPGLKKFPKLMEGFNEGDLEKIKANYKRYLGRRELGRNRYLSADIDSLATFYPIFK